MNSTEILNNLQRWTPFSVGVVLTVFFSLAVAAYCVIVNKELPSWDVSILIFAGSMLAGPGLISHGVTVANGVAKSTAQAVVREAVSQGVITTKEDSSAN